MEQEFKVKLESMDPTGIILTSQELSMVINDNNRLFIHIGECLYQIDTKGFINRVVLDESLR